MSFLVLLSMLALGAPAPNAGAEDIEAKPRLNGEIRGRVIALDTGVALNLTTVQLKGTKTATMTSPDGSFRIKDVPPGIYVLEIKAEGKPYRFVEVHGVSVAWTETNNIPMPIGLPRFNPSGRDPLVIRLGDVETVAQMLEGLLSPRLPAEKHEVVRHQSNVSEVVTERVAVREFQYPWQHRLPITSDELRDSQQLRTRLVRTSVTWTESLRRLQQ